MYYEDDASRFVTEYGVFEHDTTRNALIVLDDVIKNHGKHAAIMTDHGAQFYANAKQLKEKGESKFEKKLVAFDKRQILQELDTIHKLMAILRVFMVRFNANYHDLRKS